MMIYDLDKLSDEALVRLLREAASTWFNDQQLRLLEELIKRLEERTK